MATSQAHTTKIGDVQDQVDKTVQVLRDNVLKLRARGCNLVDLEKKAEELYHSSGRFHKTTKKLKRKMWWKNVSLLTWVAGIGLVVVVIGAIVNAVTPIVAAGVVVSLL